jgi:hypothetical protein
LNKNPKIALAALLIGLVGLLLTSCGDDSGTNPRCVNCGFWDKAFGGVGRFPVVSPDDSNVIAFSSNRDDATYEHIWVAKIAEEGDTTRFYQITADSHRDLKPAWSPDGKTIAFERDIDGRRDIFAVDVSELTAPGTPIRVTDYESMRESNMSPSWVRMAEKTWISFCNSSAGGNNYDIWIIDYPGLAEKQRLSLDPADFAKDENNVMSFIYRDKHASSNGTNLITFSSPDRERVGDIKVIARSEEQPDTTVTAAIFVDGKDSGKTTPYTFRYRPSSRSVEITGLLDGYCTQPEVTVSALPGGVTTSLLDFVHTHGTLAVASNPGAINVFIDSLDKDVRTPSQSSSYVSFECIPLGEHEVFGTDIYGVVCSPVYTVTVLAGETTFITLDCTGSNLQSERQTHGSVGESTPRGGPALAVTLTEAHGAWLVDLNGDLGPEDDHLYLIDSAAVTISYPALSPDSKYVAYIRGEDTSRQLVISDVSGLLAGTGEVNRIVIGFPGSSEDIECWRMPERVSWFPSAEERKVIASLSVCRGGNVADDFEVWIGDLSDFID